MQYLGVDISKLKFDCCIFIDNQKKKTKIFDNNPSGFIKLLQWLEKINIDILHLAVIMEATSIYHENLANYLYTQNIKICVSNPARVRRFAQGLAILNKTDDVDASVLAQYGKLAQNRYWQPDSKHLRSLKQLMLRRDAYLSELKREKNRLEKTKCSDSDLHIIEMIQDDIQHLNNRIQHIDILIKQTIEQDSSLNQDFQLLKSIPAVGERTSVEMLSLFHSKDFDKAKQAAAFCGLVPLQRQSGTSIRGASKLSKTGSSKIRAKLYMAAVTAIRYNPHIKALYERLLQNGKAKMAALCAAMRKLVHICYGVLKHQHPYNPNYIAAV